MSLLKSYTGSFRQGNASTISKASGSWAMKLAATIWGMRPLFWTQVRPRNHNMQGRDSEVHQHIQALSRIWTKCGKKHFGKHPSHLPACDAEVSARLHLEKADLPSSCRAPSVGKWTSCNLYTLKIPNRFGGSQERSIQCYWYIPIYIEIDVKFAKWIN